MSFLDKLERKFGRIAINNLMKYIVMITSILFAITYITRNYYFLSLFELNPHLIMKGQVWRLITFIFIPSSMSPISFIITMYFYYMIGNGLEEEWGSFRFNVYYILGMIGTILAGFIANDLVSATYLNLSLFLAFARIYPDFQILLFFILPIKIRYLAIFNWIFIGYTFAVGNMSLKLAAIASIVNYLIFFGKEIYTGVRNNKRVYDRRKEFKSKMPKIEYYHKCSICGITEKDNPDMDFRYCSTCEGNYEYCMDHLKSHEHVVKSKIN